MDLNVHSVWAERAGSVVPIYFGKDGSAAEAAYNASHLDGSYSFVGWSPQQQRPLRHTTPEKDGCAPVGEYHAVKKSVRKNQ